LHLRKNKYLIRLAAMQQNILDFSASWFINKHLLQIDEKE
jgi:hypothetical protein